MGCRPLLIKVMANLANTVLSVLGIGLIALSVYELNTSTRGTFEHVAIVVQIFIGSLVILTSFLGCFVACRRSLGLTWSYATCLLLLLAFQVYIIVAAHSTDYARNAGHDFDVLWHNYTSNVAQIAEIEQKYKCCGRDGSQDYVLMGRAIPKDCYEGSERASGTLFAVSCLRARQEEALRRGEIGLRMKWTLFVVEILALALAALLGNHLRNQRRRQQFGK